MKINESLLRRVLCFAFFAFGSILTTNTIAQAYPSKPIRLIVPFPPGGPSDIIARAFSDNLSENLGQQVVIDNRGGAAQIVGAQILARSNPDGYTLMLPSNAALSSHPVFYSKLPYDPAKDFAPITQVTWYPLFVIAYSGLAANNIPELVRLAKAKPGQVSYGSSGLASPAHLSAVQLEIESGAGFMHVPYSGIAPALTDIIAGRVSFVLTGQGGVVSHVKSGKLKILAVASSRRLSSHPDLPTVAEAGYPGYEQGAYFAMVTRAGTSRAVIEALNREIIRTLQYPSVRQRLEPLGYEIKHGSPEELATLIASEKARWLKVQERLTLRLEIPQ